MPTRSEAPKKINMPSRSEAAKKAQRKYRLKTQHGEVFQAKERKRHAQLYIMTRNYKRLGDWGMSFRNLYES
tara:strand:+ start:38 stop:253 length:216 start_codon:yes stop_codon:yes gene_type:complete